MAPPNPEVQRPRLIGVAGYEENSFATKGTVDDRVFPQLAWTVPQYRASGSMMPLNYRTGKQATNMLAANLRC